MLRRRSVPSFVFSQRIINEFHNYSDVFTGYYSRDFCRDHAMAIAYIFDNSISVVVVKRSQLSLTTVLFVTVRADSLITVLRHLTPLFLRSPYIKR